MEQETLWETAERYPFNTAVQRLGYLFDRELQMNEIAIPLARFIEQRQPAYTRLSTLHPRQGNYDQKWKIIKNLKSL
jgi:predicted transcriptional regulator of viral defense system